MAEDPEDTEDPIDDNDNGDDMNEDGFNPEEMFDMDEEELAEAAEDLKKEQERINKMPLIQSARNILKLTLSLVETFNENSKMYLIKELMLENAYILEPKIAGAEAADLYSIRLENAVIIKIHARELLAQTSLCKAEKMTKPEIPSVIKG